MLDTADIKILDLLQNDNQSSTDIIKYQRANGAKNISYVIYQSEESEMLQENSEEKESNDDQSINYCFVSLSCKHSIFLHEHLF